MISSLFLFTIMAIYKCWDVQAKSWRRFHHVKFLLALRQRSCFLLLAPMVDDLLIGGTGFFEGVVFVSIGQVAPQVRHGAWDLEVLEGLGSHPDVLELGQDVAVQIGQLVPAHKFVAGPVEVGVEVGELFQEVVWGVGHVLDEEGKLGEDV